MATATITIQADPSFRMNKHHQYIGLFAVLIGVLFSSVFRQNSNPGRVLFDKKARARNMASGQKNALVVGATGAIGRHVVKQLCENSKWATVTCLVRKSMDLDAGLKGCVDERIVGGDDFEAALSHEQYYQGKDAVFCALGTTRGAAGSAANFYKIDHDYVKATADAAAANDVRHFSLVSAKGPADVWYGKMAIFHPLCYVKTKFDAEQSTIASKIASIAIFRPGLLDRGEKAAGRALEEWGRKVMNGVPVSDVAKAMILKAEEDLSGVNVYEDDEIRALAKMETTK